MLRAGLLLSGASDFINSGRTTPQFDDGIVTARELAQLDLTGTDLVVLSACETGLGENHGGEGIFGLRRALQEAGAGATLVTLWKIPDAETSELLEHFYQYWLVDKASKLDALRHAQRDLGETSSRNTVTTSRVCGSVRPSRCRHVRPTFSTKKVSSIALT